MPARTVTEVEAVLAERDARIAQLEQQQAASSDVLRVISESPTDLRAVLHRRGARQGVGHGDPNSAASRSGSPLLSTSLR
jgi:hypothetical protein